MKRHYFKSKLFKKYIWSYLFILLIPLIMITVFIYLSAVTNLRTEIERSHLSQLTQSRNIIDDRIKELSNIASRIAYDERLTPYRIHDPYYSREAIDALNQYTAPSAIISEMFLYFHNDNRIYSTKGMSSLDVFHSQFSFNNWSSADVIQDLNKVTFPLMRPTELTSDHLASQGSVLAYLVPITPNSPNPHGTVMYLIKQSELSSLISSILGNYQGQSYIFDNYGSILTANSQQESLKENEVSSLFQLAPGIHSQTLDGKDHSIVSVKSEENGWTYVTVMPSDQFFSSVVHVRSIIIMLFCIVVVVGAIIALLLARIQYQPISLLAEFANSRFKTSESQQGNELERIKNVLQEYISRVDLQEPYARNHFLSMLLKYGNAQGATPDMLKAFDLQFNHSQHFVMILGWKNMQTIPHNRQEVIQLLTQVEFPALSATAYGVELTQLDQVALIVSFNLDRSAEPFVHVRRIVEAVRSNVLELDMLDMIPMIGVGTHYPSPDQLNQSFIEACSAYELGMSSEQSTVTYFEKLSYTTNHSVLIPQSALLKLSQSLKQGSYDAAKQVIRPAFKNLQSPDISPLLLRCITFDILNTMLRSAFELGVHHDMQNVAPNMIFHSLDELERNFLTFASQICDEVERTHKNEELSLMDQIVDYINQHYTDSSLSLESISFEFAVSPSHISRTFKDKMGLNFIQHIWKKRMEAVMHLLKTTNDPLKDIIMQVGYLDTPNFIRKFKKDTGYTPGQYRKLYTNIDATDDSSDLET
ncbi:AraC family transcriptional regulator [Paenibacillus sp. SYP-B3998]|uniref:AraC family transcriptional regulator n=1 Tax=Paenibacillus sp. SYP-B3998 TaxID=2678564 RepID=A0A6G4A474_9BACL|nr:helix-turn-helix domain-containing protein [Paenibacillus sp. SYP-B3998]NEW09088.1 AraC family transcriptional regulator [Paenibacillus sp. SYP-B3998]